jgi:hypothetical protein
LIDLPDIFIMQKMTSDRGGAGEPLATLAERF